jgi:ABC-type uncharacterized transport system permease subunit
MLRAAVLVALYGGRSQVADISVQGAITYTGISQATIGILSLFNWYLLMNSVYTGEVATDLLKPISYYTFWLAQDGSSPNIENSGFGLAQLKSDCRNSRIPFISSENVG